MKIAVTGATGALGQSVAEALILNGHEIVAPLRGEEPRDSIGLDAVIGCSGLTPERARLERQFTDAFVAANIVGPAMIALWCDQMGLPYYHVSTDCVMGRRALPKEKPFGLDFAADPEGPPAPDDVYAWSKALGEAAVAESGARIIRTSFITPRAGMWADLLNRSEAGHASGELTLYPGWENVWWSGSTVWAVASRIATMVTVEHWADETPGAIAHVATSPIQKAEVARILSRRLGLMVQVVPHFVPSYTRVLRPTHSVPDLTNMSRADLTRPRL